MNLVSIHSLVLAPMATLIARTLSYLPAIKFVPTNFQEVSNFLSPFDRRFNLKKQRKVCEREKEKNTVN